MTSSLQPGFPTEIGAGDLLLLGVGGKVYHRYVAEETWRGPLKRKSPRRGKRKRKWQRR